MVALQDLAFEAIRPGRPCAEVDRVVRAYYEEHDLWEHWRHHVGHAIGLRYHEGPFLDRGDPTEIRPGWCSPSSRALRAGARRLPPLRHGCGHGDGVEWLTYYPRDLESLTLPV